ncbi:Flp pilus assembly protein TadG [Variovorax sp. 54]|uniref:TadE/TadG family type IV pilus assembly protein n=1 Tax=Variovorax sp. 54 TaxID=2035212 RepID=UPI000C1A5422|nr:TadE/TadG family type IV pilus assembly protein [Variovorax sp. 54]PIF74958.1 Flp pilus assembly protein TadG [Variovorax sp. 54]
MNVRTRFILTRRGGAIRIQRGVAAIEFALVFSMLILVLYGIATFGAVLYIQQAIARAAEDGARVASMRPTSTELQQNIIDVVRDSLAESLVVPSLQNANTAARRTWIANNVGVTVDLPGTQVVVKVKYPYGANRLLPTIPLVDTSRWMPSELKTQATAARKT